MSVLEAVGWQSWVVHFLIAFPVLGGALVGTLGRARAKEWALAIAAIEFLVSAPLWFAFNPGLAGMQFAADVPWIPQWGIHYRVGIDGISLLLVLLTTALAPLVVLGSFRYITKREPLFYGMMLVLQSGIIGVFVALDLFLFFVFWEIMLVPMYFIIGLWGGERRIYAAI